MGVDQGVDFGVLRGGERVQAEIAVRVAELGEPDAEDHDGQRGRDQERQRRQRRGTSCGGHRKHEQRSEDDGEDGEGRQAEGQGGAAPAKALATQGNRQRLSGALVHRQFPKPGTGPAPPLGLGGSVRAEGLRSWSSYLVISGWTWKRNSS